MSLKAFHIVFIVLSISLAIGFGGWCLRQMGRTEHAGYGVAAGVSTLVAVALVYYFYRFLRKFKRIGYL